MDNEAWEKVRSFVIVLQQGDAERQSACCENQAGHYTQHFGVELELGNRHYADDEHEQARNPNEAAKSMPAFSPVFFTRPSGALSPPGEGSALKSHRVGATRPAGRGYVLTPLRG